MPNDTDATIFKKAGVPTMSFAFAGIVHYHRATDSPDELDPRQPAADGRRWSPLARHSGPRSRSSDGSRGGLPTSRSLAARSSLLEGHEHPWRRRRCSSRCSRPPSL
ncbi:MAG: M28 family peptidase [Myxococcales bacterium]|nr:M28 family peptidase [Myxococcales bacterium]